MEIAHNMDGAPHAVSLPNSKPAEEHAKKKVKPNLIDRLRSLGPGLITGASDDDPSGIATYSVVGARVGFGMVWTAALTFPLIAAIDYVSARIALVSGQGIAGVLRENYPRWLLFSAVSVLVIANVINAATDISAIGAAFQLLFPGVPSVAAGIIAALAVLVLVLLCPYRLIAGTFKYLTLALLFYIAAALVVKIDWPHALLQVVMPRVEWNRDSIAMLVAILGTTISPYCFFWQATQEVEEERSEGRCTRDERQGATEEELELAAFDVDSGSFVAVAVMCAIMICTAATLNKQGITQIDSAVQAAEALRPIAGDFAFLLFALGIIGAGLLAVPVLIGSAAYAVAESLGWEANLTEHTHKENGFRIVVLLSTIVAIAIVCLGVNPMHALYWTAILNGVLAPPLLLCIILISNNESIMGRWTNGPLSNFLSIFTFLLMALSSLVLIWLSLMEL